MQDVSKTYVTAAERIRAVDGVSVDVAPGEFVCLYGASGSGKSTLLRLLAGLLLPDQGEVRIGGERIEVLSTNERARLRLETIGVVFQHDNLVEEFTVAENVALPLELRGGYSKQVRADEVTRCLSLVGIENLARRWPRELSGGQQQRVGIARALVGDRRLLLADEPTGALDSVNSRALYALVESLCGGGVTAVISTHDPMAREHADRVLAMTDGRVVDGEHVDV